MKIPDLQPLLRTARKFVPIAGLAYFAFQIGIGMVQIMQMQPSVWQLLGNTLLVAVVSFVGATSKVAIGLGLIEAVNCSAAIWGKHNLEYSPYLDDVDRWLKWVGLAMIGLGVFFWVFSLGRLLTGTFDFLGPKVVVGTGWTLTFIRSSVFGLVYFGFGEIVRLLGNLAKAKDMQRLQGAS